MSTPEPETEALLARCAFPDAPTVTCAVSGGPDSSALLVLAVASGRSVTAVHVDHGLRSGSGAEADVVAALAGRFGARFRSERVVVAPGANLEERCREARRGVLPDDALLGHTLDDQAETVLWHLLRGSGRTGLAAMRSPRHPLLGLRRHETAALCERLGLETVDDPTNTEPTFVRNRIRHEVLPVIEEATGRDPRPALARLATITADEDDLLESLSAGIDPTDAAALSAAPPALARRAARRWLRAADPHCRPPPFDAVERVLAVAALDRVATEIPGGHRVSRHRGRLSITDPGSRGSAE